jgi:hypothetical protein
MCSTVVTRRSPALMMSEKRFGSLGHLPKPLRDLWEGDDGEGSQGEIELLPPGIHVAPFLGKHGRPVLVTIDGMWTATAIVEVHTVDDAVGEIGSGTFDTTPVQARLDAFIVCDGYRSDSPERALTRNLLEPGVRVAPFLLANSPRG